MHDHEDWVVDTDVLNWMIATGSLRSTEDLFEKVETFTDTIVWETFDEYFGNKKEMPIFLEVVLQDYMS